MIYFGLCGTFPIPSFIGSKYFIFFINDYNRKTWAYSLKKKNSTFENLKFFKALVENGGEKISTLRIDKRGEYMLFTSCLLQ